LERLIVDRLRDLFQFSSVHDRDGELRFLREGCGGFREVGEDDLKIELAAVLGDAGRRWST